MERTYVKTGALYEIRSAVGSATVEPNIQQVKVGSEVSWSVTEGVGRVLFERAGLVDFVTDTAEPGRPAVATARVPGTHHHVINLWIGEQVPQAVRAVLIVE